MTDIEVTTKKETTEIQWSKYANYYDDMCEFNPSYQDMIELVASKLLAEDLPSNSKVIDIGAGTGNLIARIAKERPNWEFSHLDYDPGMNKHAKEKYERLGIKNVNILAQTAEESQFSDASFDVILSTNAIYAIPKHEELLAQAFRWLDQSGVFIAVDFGRPQNTNDWILYVAKASIINKGIGATIRFFKKNWEAARQNRRTSRAQEAGNYWVHDTVEFKELLEEIGFEVNFSGECYRGYSDIVVCKKPSDLERL